MQEIKDFYKLVEILENVAIEGCKGSGKRTKKNINQRVMIQATQNIIDLFKEDKEIVWPAEPDRISETDVRPFKRRKKQ